MVNEQDNKHRNIATTLLKIALPKLYAQTCVDMSIGKNAQQCAWRSK